MMDITQALATAANIMLLGMVCVFIFLGFLVVALKILEKVAGDTISPTENEITPTVGDTSTLNAQIDANVVAAITAAVNQFRQTK